MSHWIPPAAHCNECGAPTARIYLRTVDGRLVCVWCAAGRENVCPHCDCPRVMELCACADAARDMTEDAEELLSEAGCNHSEFCECDEEDRSYWRANPPCGGHEED